MERQGTSSTLSRRRDNNSSQLFGEPKTEMEQRDGAQELSRGERQSQRMMGISSSDGDGTRLH